MRASESVVSTEPSGRAWSQEAVPIGSEELDRG